jgi:hypothetical protein
MKKDIDWARLRRQHADDVGGWLRGVQCEAHRVRPAEKDEAIMADRRAGGSADPRADFYKHDRLAGFSNAELRDLVMYLADRVSQREADIELNLAIDNVLNTRYLNRHPEILDQWLNKSR